jgi:predicted metalloprotease with PDZ domain
MQLPTTLLASYLFAAFAATAAGQAAPDRARAKAQDPFADGPSITAAQATPALAEPGYLGVKADDSGPGDGIRLMGVTAGGPADKAGMKVGDLVTAVQGKAVRLMDDFAGQLEQLRAGATVTFAVTRDDEKLSIDVVMGRRQKTAPPQMRLGPAMKVTPVGKPAPLGIRVQAISDTAERLLGLPSARGAQVTRVTKNSAADKAGIPVDAVIVAIDGREIVSPDDAAEVIGTARPGQNLSFALYENGQRITRSVAVEASAGAHAVLPTPALNESGGSGTRVSLPPTPIAEPAAEAMADRVERLERRVAELEEQLQRLELRTNNLLPDGGAPRESKKPESKFRLLDPKPE